MNITMKIKYLSILPVVAVFVLSGFSLANAQSDVFTQNLYYGLQNNSQVTQLQEFLTSQNLYSGPITGNFYFLTLGAVKAFQTQQGITPAAGYFGPVTMAAANKIADTEVGASNSQAISETGTSTPSVAPASSTAQLQLQALLQEVALLEQQLQTQQSSTQAVQNLQTQVQRQTQTLQQIASTTQSNTATPSQSGSTPAPTASITVNGSANAISIPYNTATTISWKATNANSCNVSPAGWTGIASNQSTGNLTSSQTYTITCSGAGGSTSASITVNVGAAPTLGSVKLSGTNDGVNQLYTGVRDTNLCVQLFSQNSSVLTVSPMIVTDNPNNSGVGWGNSGVIETNNTPVGYTTFTYTYQQGQSTTGCNGGYAFAYMPQTDGQHIITISVLGSTQSVTVISAQQPPAPTVTVVPASFSNQTIAPNSTNQLIGSYALTASTAEGVNVSSLIIQMGSANSMPFQNLKVMVNGIQFGTTQGTLTNGGQNAFSGTPFTVPAGRTVNVNVYADTLSTASGAVTAATTLAGFSGWGGISGSSYSLAAPVVGQNIAFIGRDTMSITADASEPSAITLPMGSMSNVLSVYRFQETANFGQIKLTDLTVTDISTGPNGATSMPAFNNVQLWSGSTLLGTAGSAVSSGAAGVYNYSFHFSSPIIVPESNTVLVTLKGDVVSSGATNNSIHTFSLSSSNITAISAVYSLPVTITGSASGNPITVIDSSATSSTTNNNQSNTTSSTIVLWSNNTIGTGVTYANPPGLSPLQNPYNQPVHTAKVYIGGHSNATLQVNWTGSNPANLIAYFYASCENDGGCDPGSEPTSFPSYYSGSAPLTFTPGDDYALISIMTPTTIINNANGPQTYASSGDSTLNATLLLQ